MGKHGNGEGGITRHKKSGLYMARYTVDTPTGKKRKTVLPRPARRPQRGLQRPWRKPRKASSQMLAL